MDVAPCADHDAGRRGGAAHSVEPGEQVAGLEEVTSEHTSISLWFLPLWFLPHTPSP